MSTFKKISDHTVNQSYSHALSTAKECLQRLRVAALVDFHGKKDSGEINWGDVGDIEHLADQLQEITDRLYKEGEYAQ